MQDADWSAVAIDPNDDVAVALRALEPGEARCRIAGATVPIAVVEPIPMAHKVALRDIAEGASVLKYGEPIGVATAAIRAGAHVHVHNVRSRRARAQAAEGATI